MSKLGEILQASQIYLDVNANDIDDLFHLASTHFSKQINLSEKTIFECLKDRENLGSTGLGAGVAIPHGRVQGLKVPLASFYRLSKGVDFSSSDALDVDVIFFLLVPEQATQKHLDLLSEIAQILANKIKRNELRSALNANLLLENMLNRVHTP